jgi:hypothetical protein
LAEKVNGILSNRIEKTLYIKADAHTPYANLIKVVDVRTASVDRLTLLTAHAEEPGAFVPRKGLELLVAFASGPLTQELACAPSSSF